MKIKITEWGIYGTHDKILHFVLPQYTYFICFLHYYMSTISTIHSCGKFKISHLFYLHLYISRSKMGTYALKVEQLMKENSKEIVKKFRQWKFMKGIRYIDTTWHLQKSEYLACMSRHRIKFLRKWKFIACLFFLFTEMRENIWKT